MSSLATQTLHSDIEVPCPQCGYPLWVLWAEIVVQTAVRCPACRCQDLQRGGQRFESLASPDPTAALMTAPCANRRPSCSPARTWTVTNTTVDRVRLTDSHPPTDTDAAANCSAAS